MIRDSKRRCSASLLTLLLSLVILVTLSVISQTSFFATLPQLVSKQQPDDDGTITGKHGRSGTEKRPNNNNNSNNNNNNNNNNSKVAPNLGVLASRNDDGWFSLNCDVHAHLRSISIEATEGNLTFYVYNSEHEDVTATKRALRGWYFERDEIGEFLRLSRELPLIDIGANLGLVTLQAAMQGREVVAVEPVPQNALRLCRSVLDFGYANLVHVIQNAVSSREGNVTLSTDTPKGRTLYHVSESTRAQRGGTVFAHSIWLDRLLGVLPFNMAALKIDVESHEGHVLARADRLFQEVDIPMVWLEWKHVKAKAEYGGAYIIQFMERHNMTPYNLMTGQRLSTSNFLKWPFTVLWRREK